MNFFIFSNEQEIRKSLSRRDTANENKQFKETKKLINILSDSAFKGTVVNQALPSLLDGLLEITLTVPCVSLSVRNLFEGH